MKESEIIKAMEELIDTLGNNVKSIKYNTYNEFWEVEYNSNLQLDEVRTEDLIEFLQNA